MRGYRKRFLMASDFFHPILTLLPFLLVWVVGMLLALVFWRQCPQACLLQMLACLLGLVSSLGVQVLEWFWIPLDDFFMGGFLSIIFSVAGATAWALMIAATLCWRNPARRPTPRNDFHPPPRRSVNLPPPIPIQDDDAETIREKP